MPGNQSAPEVVSSQSSSGSNAVSLVSGSGNLSAPASLQPTSPAFFKGVATLAVENIIRFLPVVDKGYRGFFRAFVTTNDVEYEAVRQGVLNGMQAQFLHNVADAEMRSAEAILKLAMENPTILKKLLITNKHIIQKNGLIVTGTALEIAFKCWDWSSCAGGQDEMAEMLMRYMRMMPAGEAYIQAVNQKLFLNDLKAHQEAQLNKAEEFANNILEPLADTIKNASANDIKLVYALTDEEDGEVDAYIVSTLADNSLWKALMKYRAAIRTWMKEDRMYNPNLLQQAFAICKAKYEKEGWQANFSEGTTRLRLLAITGIGGIQVCSPTLVQMLFARGGIWNFHNMNEEERKNFKVEREADFQYGGGSVFAASMEDLVLLGLKYWADGVRTWASGLPWAKGYTGTLLSNKNTTLGIQFTDALTNQPR